MQQEHAALAGLQILTEVHPFVMRLTRTGLRKRPLLLEAVDDMVLAKVVAEFWLGIAALIEAHQMLQLIRQHATDFNLHAGQVARHHGNPLAAA